LAQRLISLNSNVGAFVDILATIPVTRWEAMEDEAAAVQGIQVKSKADAFATTNVFSFGSQPIKSPSDAAVIGRPGAIIGIPAQGQSGAFNARAADKILSARSNGAAGTTLRFIESE
jgi:hypothetical protein